MVPTRRFWLFAALGIPFAAIAATLGSPQLAVAYDLLLLGTAWGSTFLAPNVSHLKFRRRFDSVLSVRVPNKVDLFLENEGVEPFIAVLRDEAPPTFAATEREFPVKIAPGDIAEIVYHVTPPERGDDSFRGTFLRIACPLGLAWKQVSLSTAEPVRVYPNVLALREFDLLNQKGRLKELGIRRARMRGIGTEFESLREYAQGDDYRKIDWKASGRRNKLVVRQYEQERNQVLILCIDVGRHMLSEVNGVRKLDHVLDALLMLTQAASRGGDFVGLLVYSDTVQRYIPPRKGRNQVGYIIEAVHDLIAEPVESNSGAAFAYLSRHWNRRALLINFTDYEDVDRARILTTTFGPMTRRHLALLVRILDAKLLETVHSVPTTVREMYAQAAATMLLDDRDQAGNLVAAAGIHTLDSEPQDLAANLVSYYFQVKERNLL